MTNSVLGIYSVKSTRLYLFICASAPPLGERRGSGGPGLGSFAAQGIGLGLVEMRATREK